MTNPTLPEELRIFLLESSELTDTVEEILLELEKGANNPEQLNKLFRALHTIKGNSAFLGLRELESLCHEAETIFDYIRQGRFRPDQAEFSAFFDLIDALRALLQELERSGTEGCLEFPEIRAELKRLIAAVS